MNMMGLKQAGWKRWMYALVAIAGVGILTLAWVGMRPGTSVNRRNYNKIQVGMTKAQVEMFLGSPDADLPPLSYEDLHADEEYLLLARTDTQHHWQANKYMITVDFDRDGRVVGKSYSRDPDVSLFRRFIDWLGW